MDPYWFWFLVSFVALFGAFEYLAWRRGGTLSQRVWRALPSKPWLRWVIVASVGAGAVWLIGHLAFQAW